MIRNLLSLLFIGNLVVALNYSSLSAFNVDGCGTTDHVINSPIIIEEALCGPYGSFTFNLTNTTLGTMDPVRSLITGGPTFPYPSQNALIVNGTNWNAVEVVFRRPAEHKIFLSNASANFELQILLKDDQQNLAQLSFLLNQTNNSLQAQAMNQTNVFSTDGTVLNAGFAALSAKIAQKLANFMYLNVWTYNGTLTYPENNTCQNATWYIYGSGIYISSDVADFINKNVDNSGNTLRGGYSNARPTSGTGGGGGSQVAQRLCYTGFFEVYMGDNYGLWFALGSVLSFFIATIVMGEKPITDPDYQEEAWTHHPFYSIYRQGNDLHTRKTRCALVLATITTQACLNAVFYETTPPDLRTRGSNIYLYAIYSTCCSLVVIYCVGFILRSYYNAKYHYHKTRDESWQQKSQNRIFGYYICIFILAVPGWAITAWQMYGLHAEIDSGPSNMWIASFFIGIALELLIIDPFVCLLASGIGAFRSVAKRKGYMYDNVCHETYMHFLKLD